MPKNPVVMLLVCAVVVIWNLYELFAPGEAQAGGVIALEWICAIGGSAGAIPAIYQLVTGRQLGAKG